MRLVCVALLSLVALSYQNCAVGEFLEMSPDRDCVECFRGSYCPGNDHVYTCGQHEYAPKFGMSACLKCSAEKTNSSVHRTFCILNDTPTDVKELDFQFPTNSVYVSNTNNSFVVESYVKGSLKRYMVNFYAPVGAKVGKIELYASRKTGKPNETNHDYKLVADIPTQFLMEADDSPDDYQQQYFTISPVGASRWSLRGETYYIFTVPNTVVAGKVMFSVDYQGKIPAMVDISHSYNRDVIQPNRYVSHNYAEGLNSAFLVFDSDGGDILVGVRIDYEALDDYPGTITFKVQLF